MAEDPVKPTDDPGKPIDQWRENSDAYFGEPIHVLDGALSLAKLDSRANLKRGEIEKALSAFAKHPVSNEE